MNLTLLGLEWLRFGCAVYWMLMSIAFINLFWIFQPIHCVWFRHCHRLTTTTHLFLKFRIFNFSFANWSSIYCISFVQFAPSNSTTDQDYSWPWSRLRWFELFALANTNITQKIVCPLLMNPHLYKYNYTLIAFHHVIHRFGGNE